MSIDFNGHTNWEEFQERAVIAAQRSLGLPLGWWGTWRDVRGPGNKRVFFSAGAWTVSVDGKRISRHDSRQFAIKKATRL